MPFRRPRAVPPRCITGRFRRATVPLLAAACLATTGATAAPAAPDAPARAEAGTVKRVNGEVHLLRDGQPVMLAPGTRIRVGDVLRTSDDGGASITLADDTLLSAGPRSELVISEFAYDATSQQGGMLLSVWRGVVSVVTGALGKRQPERVRVRTRTIVLGVRGTEFIVDAGDGTTTGRL